MTLAELEDTLPSGLHDAMITSLSIDYVKREARLVLDVSVGDPDSDDEELRDAYRGGELTISGLLYWIIEPPDARYSYGKSGRLWIDAGSGETASFKPSAKLPEPLPDGAFSHWIFVQDWNACMYLAATDASFEWKE